MTALITPRDIKAFRAALIRCMGLRFSDESDGSLREVLRERMLATRAAAVDTYLCGLGVGSVEEEELARALCVNETYFLRNAPHFRVFEDAVRARAAGGRRYLRVLSAGCSSGEEAYSIAITLRAILPDLPSWDIHILGIDVDPDVIAKARAGRYSSWSLRSTPEDIRRRYFDTSGAGHVVRDEVRRMVRFERKNLASEDPQVWRAEAWDVVFCRNVLMYLGHDVMRDILARIAASLAPAGLLFVGHAESLREATSSFEVRQAHDTFFYERRSRSDLEVALAEAHAPMRAVQPPPPHMEPADRWCEVIAESSRRVQDLSPATAKLVEPAPATLSDDSAPALDTALRLMEQERFSEALAALPDGRARHPKTLLLRAALLVTRGDLDAASSACSTLLQLDEMNAGAHYVMALCHDQQGDADEALRHDRIAAYLDHHFAMPHIHMGLLARRAGDADTARRELTLALTLLARERPERFVLFGGGFGREALMKLCHSQLQHRRAGR